MSKTTTVVDYGVGNLYSVRRALESCGAERIVISSSPADIAYADRLILPGVGAFEDGMQGLRARALTEPIASYARSGRPLLGICLGMQMLASESEEFGRHDGLNLVPGKVVPIPRVGDNEEWLKVPFVGWSSLTLGSRDAIVSSCLKGIDENDAVYLVHSFHVLPDDPRQILATYKYGKHQVTAAIRRENITGLQFHPEKSGKVGLRIVANFIAGE